MLLSFVYCVCVECVTLSDSPTLLILLLIT